MATLVENFKKTSGLTVPGFKRKDALTTYSDIINNPTINGTVSKENQDYIFFDNLTLNEKEIKILIVCDGHGILYGRECSKFVTEYLHTNIIKKIEEGGVDIDEILKSVFIESNSCLLEFLNSTIPYTEIKNGILIDIPTQKNISCGTTASVALIIDNNLFIANCGDSDILLLQKNEGVVELTTSHDPISKEEYDRIKKGVEEKKYKPGLNFIFSDPNKETLIRDTSGKICNKHKYIKNVRGCPSTYVKKGDVSLAITRTIGDFYLQEYGVTSEPSIGKYNMENIEKGSYLLVMSDGVSDNWKFEDIHKFMFSHDICLNEKLKLFMIENLSKSDKHFGPEMDNQSAILRQI